MKLKPLGPNTNVIELDNMRILVSYETPVAAWIAGQGFVKTEKKWSATTSKHVTQWLNTEPGDGSAQFKPQTFFDELFEGKP